MFRDVQTRPDWFLFFPVDFAALMCIYGTNDHECTTLYGDQTDELKRNNGKNGKIMYKIVTKRTVVLFVVRANEFSCVCE